MERGQYYLHVEALPTDNSYRVVKPDNVYNMTDMPITAISYAAEELIGGRYNFIEDVEKDLFSGSNTLETIREILTGRLGVDPEDEIPDAELMVRGKQFVMDEYIGNEDVSG